MKKITKRKHNKRRLLMAGKKKNKPRKKKIQNKKQPKYRAADGIKPRPGYNNLN